MDESIFTRIVKGEIPCHKIYEDELTFAFLDIMPARPGHLLVIPKKQVDRLEDLPPTDYQALMQTVKKLMNRVVEVFGADYRACLKLEGFDVPHAHVHIIPCRDAADFNSPKQRASDAELAKMAEALAL